MSLLTMLRNVIQTEKHFIALLSVGILAGVCIWGVASPAVFAQAIPGTTPTLGNEKQVSASAILLDGKGSPVPNGEYEVRFSIYRADRATSDPYPSDTDATLRVWEETQQVTVKNGIMNAYLGVTTPFPGTLTFEGGEYFLGVRVGTDSEMVPRKKFGTFTNAINSQFLRGKTIGTNAGDIVTYGTSGKIDIKQLPTGTSGSKLLLANNKDFTGVLNDVSGLLGDVSGLLGDVSNLQGDSHAQNTDTGTDSLTFNIGSGTAVGSNNFDLTVSNATNAPTLRYSGSAGEWQFSDDGTTFASLGAGSGSGITGTGTNGFVSYWTGASTLGSEAYLATSRGGTGLDTSSSTGIPVIASGTWSVASSLGVSQGGTGLTSTPLNGQLLIGNGSDFSLATLSVGNGLSVTNGSGSVSLALDVTTTGTTSTTQSNSGLELVASGLRLLGGCSDGEILKWDSGSSVWTCSSDLGATTSIINVNEGATAYTGIDTLTFDANDFSITQLGSEATVAIDYANSGIARLGQDETVTGAWTFSGNATFGTIAGGVWNGTAIGATYGGTGINTSGSTGVPYITGGTWSVDTTALAVSHGGTGATSLNNLITLGTHTTGNYVAAITAGDGISGSAGSEGATPTLSVNLLTSADGTGSTSSNSGLEFQGTSSNELSLIQGCADNEVLSWNDGTSVWQCASVSGVGGVTGSATSGQVAYWSGTSTISGENQLAVSRGGTNIGSYAIGDILYASGATTLAKLADIATGNVLLSGGVGVAPSWGKVALGTHTTGNYVANASTSTLTGLTGGSGGSAGASLSLALDYSTALAGDPALSANNAIFGTNGLIFEGATADTFETFITLADPSADRTFTFPDLSGTIATINGAQTFTNAIWNATAIGATYGGTGINTASSTGVPYISSGTWSVDATSLAVAHGGTGVATFGGTNTLLYTTSANTLASLATANSSILVTNGSGVPSLATDIPTAVTIGGAYVYRVGGTDVSLADGGTGASLSDPNADNILFWDDSAGASTWLALSSNLSITATTLDLASSVNINTLQLGANGTDGSFILYSEQGATDYTTTFQPGTQTQNITYTLPNDDGTSGQVLLTDGSGTLSWSSVSGAGGVSGTGTSGYATYWDSTNSIAAEQYLSLTRGGTGTTLSNPGADRVLFWDNSGGALTWLAPSSNLSITATTLDLASSVNINTLQLGANGTDGSFILYSEQGATDYTTTFQPGTQTQDITYTLPNDDGTSGQVLLTDGSGTLSWSSVSGAGGVSGTGTSGYATYWDSTNSIAAEQYLSLTRGGTGTTLSNPGADRILFWDNSGGALTWLAPSSNLSITATTLDLASSVNINTLQLGANGTDGSFILYSEQGATDYTTTFQPGTQTQDITYTLPNDDGTSGQVLITDGSGVLSWTSAGSGGIGDITAIGDVTSGDAFTSSGIQGTSLYFYDVDGRGQLTSADLSAVRTYTLPDATGTIITTGNLTGITATGTIASGTWNGTAIGATYGGTGLNTSASTGVPTINSGTWSVASSLGVALGGTGTTALASGGILYGNGTSAIGVLGVMTNGQLLIGDGTGAPTLAALSEGNGVTVTNGAGSISLSVNLLTSADGTGSTSSNSGLEFQGTSSNELSLIQGCADNEVLSWNDGTSVWQCASVSGVGGVTGSATSGQVAYWSGTSTISGENQLAVSRGGTNIGSYAIGDILYASGATTLAKLADIATGNVLLSGGVGVAPSWGKVALGTSVSGTLPVANGGTGATSLNDLIALTTNTTGNYVASISNGNGISGGDGGGEGSSLTLALSALTGDWNQTGAYDIVLNNASSELKILESSGATFFGIFDVGDLSSNDKTYTFPNATGTVALGTGAANAVAYWSGANTLTSEAQLSNTRGGTGQDSSGWTGVPYVTAGAWNVSSTLSLALGGTGTTLSNPGADRVLFWDNSGGALTWLAPSSNLSITATTLDLASSVNINTLQLGANGTDGSFILYSEQGATDYTTTFQPGTQTQNITYTLPNDDGTSGQVLLTDGSGTLSWSSVSGAGGVSGTGTSGYATYWDSTNSIAAEQYLSLTRGGTGTTLSNPGADRVLFWDNSGGALTWLAPSSNLSITATTPRPRLLRQHQHPPTRRKRHRRFFHSLLRTGRDRLHHDFPARHPNTRHHLYTSE
ncbi:MAG: hypothetical protein IPJ67_00285 [Candidatus Moraniibacteriota bacterium]|nr:MAG: hypothetical protein IPJ67_00285 [Candidatus Moranbacteria bacterium]